MSKTEKFTKTEKSILEEIMRSGACVFRTVSIPGTRGMRLTNNRMREATYNLVWNGYVTISSCILQDDGVTSEYTVRGLHMPG